ncbi:MAG TPA: ABC transporter ATP-binding protein [Acetobacteraceae bacterium]|nr:ABC transporter ATP-binding protein [Acetobacteraceae bacterium]
MSRICIEGLAKSYGRGTVLGGIDLDVAPERLTVFCGPPGSGKSVLFRVIVGLEAPDAGRILVDGADITPLPAARRTIGYVPQSFALFPHMSVFDNVAYPLKLQGVERAEIARRVAQAAELLRISKLLRKRPSELSGGEKQRAALARGILKDARIFILDDPLVGLDFKLREGLMEDLAEMRAELGATFLYATSDPLEALMMADDLVVLDGGRVADANRVDRLYAEPRHLRAAELVGFPRCNVIPGKLEGDICTTALLRFRVVAERAPAPDVVVVIRPEQVVFADGAAHPPGAPGGVGTVQLLEDLGAECVVHLAAAGETLVTTAPSRAVAHLDVGAPYPFVLRPRGISVFDRASGARIGSGDA